MGLKVVEKPTNYEFVYYMSAIYSGRLSQNAEYDS
jgi:hypothetical protein